MPFVLVPPYIYFYVIIFFLLKCVWKVDIITILHLQVGMPHPIWLSNFLNMCMKSRMSYNMTPPSWSAKSFLVSYIIVVNFLKMCSEVCYRSPFLSEHGVISYEEKTLIHDSDVRRMVENFLKFQTFTGPIELYVKFLRSVDEILELCQTPSYDNCMQHN
jgi:hypothetical protein